MTFLLTEPQRLVNDLFGDRVVAKPTDRSLPIVASGFALMMVRQIADGLLQTLNSFTWLLFRVGWGFRFTDDNFRYTVGNGEGGLGAVLALSEPGGFSIGLSAGFSIF